MRDHTTARVVVDRVAIDAEELGDLVGGHDLARRFALGGHDRRLQSSARELVQRLCASDEDAARDELQELIAVTWKLDDELVRRLLRDCAHDASPFSI